MATEKTKKNDKIFSCEKCDFNTCKKTDFYRHLLTQKHKNMCLATNGNIQATYKNEKNIKCENCYKIYYDRSGLWRHKKKCKQANNYVYDKSENCDKEFIMQLIKENNEFKNMMIKFFENGTTHNTNINNINNINSNNKTFNLQLFLNETCKNAMNIMDFVNSIQLQLTDLEKVGELGYVEGISKIIINNLKLLDVTERPVHCSDMKREVLYVKDDNKWEKEETENPKIKKAIKCIANKNILLIPEWKQKYPDCNNSDSRKSDIINKIILESMETNKEKTNKIIKKIAKEVGIDKETNIE
jgi:hypothetical protein